MINDGTARQIAWDGVSFEIPANWEVASCHPLRGGTRMGIEDECGVRLEMEWTRLRHPRDAARALSRLERRMGRLTRRAHRREEVTGLPPDWRANVFDYRETIPTRRARPGLTVLDHRMASAFHAPRGDALLCSVAAHFMPGDREDPATVIRRLAAGFRRRADSEPTLWKVYDISFALPPDFELEDARFDIGAKLMVFRWKRRRFLLWHFSCADAFLGNDAAPETWVAGYLNGFAGLRGPVFRPGLHGRIEWRRKRRHPFGHRDEILRGCWRYEARCRRDRSRNQLLAWVFHHRHREDLDVIPPDLRFEASAAESAP